MAAADAWPAVAQSASLKEKLASAKVLAVGAGGIGCELLKTLVLTGFQDIQVVDLDTIETSNLNRQFLFRKRHVGESKASVAAQAVAQFSPGARIQAHQANIKEARFGVDFFKGFDIVLNGLDNLEARRHVNRLCLAARVPLIESGTAGYLGQVSVHLRLDGPDGSPALHSECFECQPKTAPKSFPVCTIRNTPDKPIHCVVWAKDLLFQRLFGSAEAVTDLDEKAAGEGEEGAAADGEAAAAEAAAAASAFLRREGEDAGAYAERIFDRVFRADIENVLAMGDLWKSRERPTPLRLAEVLAGSASIEPEALQQAGGSACRALGLRDAHALWSVQDNARVFLAATQLFLRTRAAEVGSAVFDKDDALAVEFVAAASNLRAACYAIPQQSLFAAKGMAGNIIHAIATTNAAIAGLIVVEAVKVLAGQARACRASFLQQLFSGRHMLTAMPLEPPRAGCPVCGTAQLRLEIDTAATTLGAFVEKVLKRRLAMNEPSVLCGGLSYEEGADLEADEVAANRRLLPLPLASLPGGGIAHGSIVSVSDQAQDFSCQLVVSHRAEWDEEKEPEGFALAGSVEAAKAGQAANGAGADAGGDSDEDDLRVMADPPPPASGRKRKAADSGGGGGSEAGPSKRQATGAGGGGSDAPIQLD